MRCVWIRSTVLCWIAATALELWVFLEASADSFHRKNFVWEGPLSLFLALLGLGCLAVFCRKSSTGRRGFAVLLAALTVAGLLAVVPVSQAPKSSWTAQVFKEERRLVLRKNGKEVKRFPIALGDPVGDKEVMGDRRTPLGAFYVCDKAPSHFYKWIGLSYPNLEDAWRGRYEGKITWVEFWCLRVENLNQRIPYAGSALGGAVGIHGGGSQRDWTLGCVALDNDDVDVLYRSLPVGSQVEIFP